jgi:hypothetical protein
MLLLSMVCLLAVAGYAGSPGSRDRDSSVLVNPSHVPAAKTALVTKKIYGNSHADTIDGILFVSATDKKRYTSGDTLNVQYKIINHSMGTVLYDFPSSCQFDLTVRGSTGSFFYSLLGSKPCTDGSSRLTLPPGTEKTEEFTGIPLRLSLTDTLMISAQMAGYPLSAVSVKAAFQSAPAPGQIVALEGTTDREKPVIEFNRETKMLVITMTRAQRLTISAFVLTGKKINKVSCERFLAPGTHLISFNNSKLADGVVIFKVEGAGFSETKTINLSH